MASNSNVLCQAATVLSLAEVVELVLSFLPERALCTAARVCRLWRDMARRISRPHRNWLSFVVHHGKNTPCTSRVSMDLMIGKIEDFLDNLHVFPQAVILFVSRSPLYKDTTKRQDLKSLLAAVKSRLPSKCSLIGCLSGGVVGQRATKQAEEIEEAEGVSLLIMPRMEGISTHIFNVNCTDVRNNRTVKERWEKSLNIPPGKRIKFAILFAKGDNNHLDVIGKVASGIWQIYDTDQDDKSDVVIIGGLVESLLDSEIRHSGVVGLGIAGDAVHAMSIVHHGDTKQGLKDSLQQLKCCREVGKETACFMVSCVGRGEKFYHAKHVEAQIFQQEFPGIPIAGFFGNGEVGLDLHSTMRRPLNDSHFLHSYSSVFCLCSLGANSGGHAAPSVGTVSSHMSRTADLPEEDVHQSTSEGIKLGNTKFVR